MVSYVTREDLIKQQSERIFMFSELNEEYAYSVLNEYYLTHKNEMRFTGSNSDILLQLYAYLKNKDKHYELDMILQKYNFNYQCSIQNAIYQLTDKDEDLEKEVWNNPANFPGVDGVIQNGCEYTISGACGDIRLFKADAIFKSTRSSYIFDKPLSGKCQIRTYDFLKENRRDYRAVISYLPLAFKGGTYHVYAKNDCEVVDLAANAYYDDVNEANKVLKGEIIKEVEFQQIEDDFADLTKMLPEFRNYDNKIQVLTLYYDRKNKGK